MGVRCCPPLFKNGHIIIDLAGNGQYDKTCDYRIIIQDGLSVQYDAAGGWFTLA